MTRRAIRSSTRFIPAACAVLLAAGSASAIITHGDGSFAAPAPDVIGRWNSNATAVAVSPCYVITAAHPGGGIGSTVRFDGEPYTVVEITRHPSADLRVARIELADGSPANLADFVGLYRDTDESGQSVVLGGFGEDRGDPVSVLFSEVGYEWAGPSTRAARWGTNTIAAAGAGSDLVTATFDPEIIGGASEASISAGDSGGGWFIERDGEWLVAGIHRGVQNGGQAIHTPPESLDGVRISTYADFIDSVVTPCPGLPCNDADLNADGILDLGDISTFVNAFSNQQPAADIDGNGIYDLGDVGGFVQAFTAGCP